MRLHRVMNAVAVALLAWAAPAVAEPKYKGFERGGALITAEDLKVVKLTLSGAGNLGKQVVDAIDDRYKSGGIGLWTKSDSVTCFDDVEVTP